jgi:biopolymer transport protein ExbD
MAISTKRILGEESVHYVSPRKKRVRPKPKMQPPLTPMIDVTFQLLLFFLLTFTFRQAEGQIPGTLPEQGEGGVTTQELLEEPIRISLRPVGDERTGIIYEIQGHAHVIRSAQELGQLLQSRATQNGTEVPVIIKSRGDVQWRWVVEAFNQSVRARFKNVGFATHMS